MGTDTATVRRLSGREDYDTALQRSRENLVVIKYYASWCRACKALAPKVEKIARSNPGVTFYEIEFESNKAMCKDIGIRVLPWIQFYQDGKVVESFSCGPSKSQQISKRLETYATGECELPEGDDGVDASDPNEKK